MGPQGARRIQSLRAFRRAEVIFDAVLFESCVGGIAVAMTLASIFHVQFVFVTLLSSATGHDLHEG